MEKGIAHYSLNNIKELITNSQYFITQTARIDYVSLGFNDDEVLEVIQSLESKDLYKSMTSFQNSSIWQDVYYKQAKNIDLYIKLQITQNAIIISFKERT
ncbi:MAG: type II toxin-antitoxin system MqsR family toxin [Arcobacteraceae bacterium]|nr:type II toxin-antitoxin system MqsR family toxin [Arcobacteraceae bacterium]